jgi:hypothetical protein
MRHSSNPLVKLEQLDPCFDSLVELLVLYEHAHAVDVCEELDIELIGAVWEGGKACLQWLAGFTGVGVHALRGLQVLGLPWSREVSGLLCDAFMLLHACPVTHPCTCWQFVSLSASLVFNSWSRLRQSVMISFTALV